MSVAGNALARGESQELFAHSVDYIVRMGRLLRVPIEFKASPGIPGRGIALPTA